MVKAYELPIPFGWYAVAYSDELAVGDVKALYYFDRDLVLYRSESGQPVLLNAFCPHLGAHLGHGGTVKGEHIACPFHAWEFAGDGHCKNVPYAKNMPPRVKDKQCIHSYPVVEKNQTIWAWYHPENAEPSFDVMDLPEFADDAWTPPLRYDWEFRGAIQETSENGVDAAHFIYVHTAQSIPEGEFLYEGPLRRAYYESKAPDMDEHGNIDTTGTKWRDNQLETSSYGPGQTWQKFMGLFDTLMQGTVTPIDANRVHLRFAFIQPKDQHETQQVMATALMEEITRQVQQDIPIWENKIYQPDPVLCDGDGPIAKHRKWFSQFYAEWAKKERVA